MGAFTTGEGFAAIVPMHAPAMLRVATALIGPADAEDAVQEAAMRAWQAWATLRNPDAARSWLLQITVNVCRGWRRGLKGRQEALTPASAGRRRAIAGAARVRPGDQRPRRSARPARRRQRAAR